MMTASRAMPFAALVLTLAGCPADRGGSGDHSIDPPSANAGVDQSAWKGSVVTLDARGSRASAARGLTYAWRQTEGQVVPLSDDRAPRPSFVAPRAAGVLRFTVEVNDGQRTSEPDEVIVVVQNRAPWAAAGPDQVAPVGNVVALDPANSSDPDGDPITTTWFQVSGPPVTLAPHPDGSASFIAPASPAVLEFGLVASDGEASSSADGLRVQVVDEGANWPPVAHAGLDREAPRRSVVTLSGWAADRESDPITWTWNQVGGPAVTLLDADGPTPSFVTPAAEADLEFQLVVADALSTGADRVVVRVRNQAPVISALALSPAEPVTSDPLSATLTVGDADDDALTLTWEWLRNGTLLAGETSSTLDPALTTKGDLFVVRVTASDGTLEASAEATITIRDAPPVLTVTAPETVAWGVPMTFTVSAQDPDAGEGGGQIPDIVLVHGPSGMTVSPAGAGAWTPELPMFDRTLDVSFSVGVDGSASLHETRTLRVEDPDRQYPLRRTGIEIPIQNGLVAADLDGDGRSELLVASRRGLFELAYDGAGAYAQRWVYPFATGATSLAAVEARDVDGDGKPEIYLSARSSWDPSLKMLVKLDGQTRREVARAQVGCIDLEAADLDGDGAVELACLVGSSYSYGSDGRLAVLDGVTLATKWQTASMALGSSLAVGDVDGDRAPEIVVANGYVFAAATGVNEWAYASAFGAVVDTGDLDGDGVEEIVGMDNWDRFRGFSAVLKAPIWEQDVFDSDALLVTDADGDGVTEIVVGDGQWGNVTGYRYQGATNTLAVAFQVNSQDHGVTSLAAADLDGDGARELAWGSGASSSGEDIFVVAGFGVGLAVEWKNVNPSQLDGPFIGAKPARTVAGAPAALLFDVPSTNSGYDGARLVRLDPATGALAISAEIGTNWSHVGALDAVDYDADGVDEAFMGSAALYDEYLVAWDFAAGTAAWSSPTGIGAAAAVTHADLNADGFPDLLAVTTDGFVTAYDVKNSTLLWKSTGIGGGVDVGVADVDGDGASEIVALGSSRLVLFRKASSGTIPWIETRSFAITGSDLEIADCDGDGAPELHVLGAGSVTRFDGELVPMGSFRFSGEAQSLYVEELGQARKNLVLAAGDPWSYGGAPAYLSAVDAVTGATVWSSPPLWGTVPINSLGYTDLDGDGYREIAFGTTMGMYLTR